MRVFLNSILSFIGSESLTDLEYGSFSLTDEAYDTASYEALKGVLQTREGVSGQLKQLSGFYQAKGVALGAGPVFIASSEILIGGPLD